MSRFILTILLFVLCLSCTNQKTIQTGDEVILYFRIINQRGERIDDSYQPNGNLPLRIVIGKHFLIEGFEKELIGLKVGQRKQFKIPATAAYKERGVFYLNEKCDTVYLIQPNEDLSVSVEILNIVERK